MSLSFQIASNMASNTKKTRHGQKTELSAKSGHQIWPPITGKQLFSASIESEIVAHFILSSDLTITT